jgi:hypothetical protein
MDVAGKSSHPFVVGEQAFLLSGKKVFLPDSDEMEHAGFK